MRSRCWLATFSISALASIVAASSIPLTTTTSGAATARPAPTHMAAAPPATAEMKVIRTTMGRGVHFTPLLGIDRFAAKYGLRTQYIDATTNAEMQRYLQQGQVDVGALGYQSPAIMAEQKVGNVKIIAGLYNAGFNLIMRKGVDLRSWKDLEGKKIGRPPGTYVAILFTLAAEANGVDLARVNIVNTTVFGTTELQALKRGELDGFLMWSPLIDKGVVDGYAYYPPCCDINKTKEYGDGNQILGASAEFLKDRTVVVNLLKALVESKEFYWKNPDETVQVAARVTGADRAAIVEALKHSTWETRVDIATAVNVARQGPKFGFTKADMSNNVAEYFDLTYLSEATGKPVGELNRFAR